MFVLAKMGVVPCCPVYSEFIYVILYLKNNDNNSKHVKILCRNMFLFFVISFVVFLLRSQYFGTLFRTTRTIQNNKKIGLFEKWGATPKNSFFAFSALFFIFLNYNSGTI